MYVCVSVWGDVYVYMYTCVHEGAVCMYVCV